MKHVPLAFASASIAALCVIHAPAVLADDHGGQHNDHAGQQNAYVVTTLDSDLATLGGQNDPVLQNAWGVAFAPGGAYWISDNNSGCSTLYDGDGTIVPLQVKIPLPGNTIPATDCVHNDPSNPANPTPAAPTGMVWNPTGGFLIPGTGAAAGTNVPSRFIFDTEDGTIAAWAGGTAATLPVDNSAAGAVYKGLALGVNAKGVFLFAANFAAGTIDVFDNTFAPATTTGGFADPSIPAGFAPFGIQSIDGDLYVTYAKQDATGANDVPGPGNGFVDIFNTDGQLLRHFAARGVLNSPWGIARASAAFGQFSGDILVGNFGDGRINVFSTHGRFLATLKGTDHQPIVIDGLWTLTLGGGAKSSSDTLYFTAGPNDQQDGRFGTITPQTTAVQ